MDKLITDQNRFPLPVISVVIPVYLGEKILDLLHARLKKVLDQVAEHYEIILVDDRSPDNAWIKITELASKYLEVKGIRLSRNFGQHYAITAGLEESRGEWIVVMDCDLQDQPEEIKKLYQKAKGGYDIVFAQRKLRQDTFFKRISSKLFYGLFSYLTDTVQDSSIANFGIYHRKVISSVLKMKDHIRYFPTMSQWVGFQSVKLEVEHAPRFEGDSSYNLKKLLNLAFNNIIAFSDKPLRLAVQLGALVSFISFWIGVFYIVKFFRGEVEVLGFTSIVISIWFLSGIIIFILGIVGIYIGKIFEKVKDRPAYIIDEKVNFDE